MVDVIIPVGNFFPASTPDRISTLNFALNEFYAKQSGVGQVIIVEQVLSGKPVYQGKVIVPHGLNVKFVIISYPVYNKQWSTNVGVLHSKAPYFIVAESDMFCYDDYFRAAVAWMKERGIPWCIGWNDLYYCMPEEKRAMMNGEPLMVWGNGRRVSPKRGSAEGGLVFFERAFYEKMGWANEWIEELGGPDNDLAERARFMSGKYPAYPQKVIHVWHPKLNTAVRVTRMSNVLIIRETRRNPRKVVRLLQSVERAGEEPMAARGKWDQILAGYMRA